MHWYRKFAVVMVVVLALALGVSAASAQSGGGGGRGRGFGGGAAGSLITALAELADVTPREVLAAWETDMTLEALAASYDISAETLIAEATANATAQLDAQVELSRLTQEEADEALATLTESFDEALATVRSEQSVRPDGSLGFDLGGRFDGGLIDSISEAVGLTAQEIAAQLADGATFAEILEAQGVEAQTIVDLVLAQAQEQAAQAVEDGRITQEQADELLATLETRIADVLENGLPLRDLLGGLDGGFGPGRMDGRGGRRGQQGGFGGGFFGPGANAQPPAGAPAGSDA